MAELLGDRIRKARLKYGMSQAELARRIGVSKNAMNEIETNKTLNPGVLQVKAIAAALRVSADYLLGLMDEVETELLAAAVA
jgi:transcriptional regulator with XRE-family HTH domain